MTIISTIDGKEIQRRSEAREVAETFMTGGLDFILEQRFVLYQPDGSPFYFPDPASHFADPYLYPIEIAYGFLVEDPAPGEGEPEDEWISAVAASRWMR